MISEHKEITLGLKANWNQFVLLVFVNALVGGMIGLERTILPKFAEEIFEIHAHTAIFSFIIVFGFTKAIANYFVGYWSSVIGRKKLLLLGWIFALPVPFMLIYAQTWNWVIAANILLGINQGLSWSTTVIMKIDLVGEKNRGLAMGLNEFAGYVAVGITAFVTAWLAEKFYVRPYPFYIGIAFSVIGFFSTLIFVRDTSSHVQKASQETSKMMQGKIFWNTTLYNRNLSSVTQAGLINNLNDGMVWGLFPIFLSTKEFNLKDVGAIASVYPILWGVAQLFTGKLSDSIGRKPMLFWGMTVQAVAIMFFIFTKNFSHYIFLSAILGIGTAMVYPTFLASIADNTHPQELSRSIGVFRLWRDSGYAFGAILSGLLADFFNMNTAIIAIAALTFLSALIILFRMKQR